MPEDDQRVLVLAHRLPCVFQRGPEGLTRRSASSGLISALEPVLQKHGGTWVGWPGIDTRRGERLPLTGAPYRIAPVALSERELASYHHGLSNRTLWPLFHSLPDRARFDRRDWPVYRAVNHRFADVALREVGESELIWVHDYQLLLAPLFLRRYLPRQRLAFFLHIPFPSFDLFRLLPWAREVLRGMLSCDLVGFQVSDYAHNFLDCAARLTSAEIDPEGMQVHSKWGTTRVGAFPVGIDFGGFAARMRGLPPRSPQTTGERRIFGADRLDYTKGIPERILAVERLFEKHPEHRQRVTFLQVAVPSRSPVAEYRALKREIEESVGRVNGRFATARWEPIRYLHRRIGRDGLAELYRDADVCLVTPLRDGMNVVAKEFIACQDEDPGVLVLSWLAGAADHMKEALRVNPYDVEKTADAIHRALEMPLEERRARMQALAAREREHDVNAWVASFLEAAAASRPPEQGGR